VVAELPGAPVLETAAAATCALKSITESAPHPSLVGQLPGRNGEDVTKPVDHGIGGGIVHHQQRSNEDPVSKSTPGLPS
jgi:hypothetical protein